MLIKRLLLVLLLCAPAWAANNFGSDGNCKANWRLESGALTTDSKGTNTLTNSGMTEDTTTYKEGACSAYANSAGDILYCTDANLDAGFPLKSGDSNKKISICGWFRYSGLLADRAICGKWTVNTNGRSILVWVSYGASCYLNLSIGYNSGNSTETVTHASALSVDTWYHFGVTYQDSDKSYRIRIWDDGASAILGVDKTGNTTNNIYVGTVPVWHIGRSSLASNCLGGQKDEIVVFDDILDTTEIDAIRAGTYSGPAASTGSQVIMVTEEDG